MKTYKLRTKGLQKGHGKWSKGETGWKNSDTHKGPPSTTQVGGSHILDDGPKREQQSIAAHSVLLPTHLGKRQGDYLLPSVQPLIVHMCAEARKTSQAVFNSSHLEMTIAHLCKVLARPITSEPAEVDQTQCSPPPLTVRHPGSSTLQGTSLGKQKTMCAGSSWPSTAAL